MRLPLIVVLCVLVLPSAFAALGGGVKLSVNENGVFTAFNEHITAGTCDVTIKNNDGAQMTGYWPVAGQCTDPAGEDYSYASTGRSLRITSASGTPDPSKRGILSHFYEYCVDDYDDNSEDCEERRDKFFFIEADKSIFNVYDTAPVPSAGNKEGFPIMMFSWCGEDTTAEYTTSTASPTKGSLHFDGSEYCARRPSDSGRGGVISNRGMYLDFAGTYQRVSPYPVLGYFGNSPRMQRYYDFPLEQACTEYAIDITQVSHGDWLKESKSLIPTSGGFQYKQTSNDNTLEVNVDVDSSGYATGVRISGDDGSSNAGGTTFTLYCVQPIDPDSEKKYCPASKGWAWSDAVNTSAPGHACCGDDGELDTQPPTNAYGGWICQKKTETTHEWKASGDLCRYPAGWKIGALTQEQIDTDAKLSYDPAYGCCSEAINHNKVLSNSTDQAVCIVQKDNRTRWAIASRDSGIIIANASSNLSIVSDGTKFLTCRQPVSGSPQVESTNPITPGNKTPDTCDSTTTPSAACDPAYNTCYAGCTIMQDPGSCKTPWGSDCNVGDSNCFINDPINGNQPCTAQPVFSNQCAANCQQQKNQCMNAIITGTCGGGAVCNSVTKNCECLTGQTWNMTQGACEAFAATTCPEGTWAYNSATQKCERTVSSISSLTSAAACNLVNNTVSGTGTERICLDQWVTHLPAQYTFNSSNNYVNLSGPTPPSLAQKKATITQVCSEGQLVPAIIKYAPDLSDFGFCSQDECYFGVNARTTVKDACVPIGTWVLEHMCVQNESQQSGVWTTRTQVIADTLYKRAQDLGMQNFVLHCDIDKESVNNVTTSQKYSIGGTPAPFVNAFCALSDAGEGKTIAIGTTLNPQYGTQGSTDPIIRFGVSPALPRFIEMLNYSGITITSETCKEIIAQDGAFHQCAINGNGSVWYNPEIGGLLFSNEEFTLENNWLDSLKSSWRNLFGSETPNPLVELNGKRLYVAKSDGKMVQASLVPTSGGGTRTTVVYQGISQGTVDAIIAGTKATSSPLGNNIIVRLDNATQQHWEQLTLVVRPS